MIATGRGAFTKINNSRRQDVIARVSLKTSCIFANASHIRLRLPPLRTYLISELSIENIAGVQLRHNLARELNEMTSNETLYTCKITFIKATSVPVADFHDLSCDPYLQATLTAETSVEQPDGVPQMLTYRTQTCRRTLDPKFDAHWVVSGIPASGFLLSVKLRDEDPGNYDDDLGKAVLRMPNAGEGVLAEGWRSGDREYKVHKRRGSVMSRLFTCTANVVTGGDVGHRVRLWVRCEVMGKAENQEDRRMYTVGPRTSMPLLIQDNRF